jgi:hypothetical protein
LSAQELAEPLERGEDTSTKFEDGVLRNEQMLLDDIDDRSAGLISGGARGAS